MNVDGFSLGQAIDYVAGRVGKTNRTLGPSGIELAALLSTVR